MRTKILKYFGMVVVLIIMVNLTSCEVSIESWYDDDDYSEIYYRTTRELCSRTWQETWEQDGEYYTQRLDFYENRTGTDIIQIEHRNGYVTEDRYNLNGDGITAHRHVSVWFTVPVTFHILKMYGWPETS